MRGKRTTSIGLDDESERGFVGGIGKDRPCMSEGEERIEAKEERSIKPGWERGM